MKNKVIILSITQMIFQSYSMYLDEQVETLEVQVDQALLQSCVVFVPP